MPSLMNDTENCHIVVRLRSFPCRRANIQVISVPASSTVRDALRLLDLPDKLEFIIAVNGQAAEEDTILSDGDTMELIPALAGG